MHFKAYAKINLCLDITGKRQDGYHELNTVMQTVNLYDVITVNLLNTKNNFISIKSNDKSLPNRGNLAFKAAEVFLNKTGIKNDVKIYIEKNIPVAAGLGGGSSDAACVINALNTITGANIKKEAFVDDAKRIGADVPFALYGKTALVTGIGENVRLIGLKDRVWLVLICPNLHVSTKNVFENYIYDGKQYPKKVERVVKALKNGDVRALANNVFNRLESVTEKRHPVITKIKKSLLNTGALTAVMSGSGPSVFGIYANKKDAKSAYERIKNREWKCVLVKTC